MLIGTLPNVRKTFFQIDSIAVFSVLEFVSSNVGHRRSGAQKSAGTAFVMKSAIKNSDIQQPVDQIQRLDPLIASVHARIQRQN